MPLIDGLVDNTLLQTMWQSGAALSATDQHLNWYSTINKIFISTLCFKKNLTLFCYFYDNFVSHFVRCRPI